MYPVDLLKVRVMVSGLESKHSQYVDAHAGDQSFARRHLHRAVKCGRYNLKDRRLQINVAWSIKRYAWCWYVFIRTVSPPTKLTW